ncbi:sugar phosphate isomerase/epimerase family protein [Siphonobacter sp. BAB-5405]|uniref:sugar phosphate isomerase/epimerase family protein n=1 Tax=Siphonobacter sp. BAB-5405 TaxID=1864825 RepID=UPI0018ED28F9
MEPLFSRRRTIGQLSGLFGGVFLPFPSSKKAYVAEPFRYCLNMSTLRGHKLGFEKELQIAAQAGFRSVEVWVDSVQDYVKQGKTLADARKLITDLGLTVENAIGFAPWIVDDAGVRSKALEQMKREMDMLAGIGCKRTAAPPMGATTSPKLDLTKVAERYRIILELGTQTGVMPHLELWGFSSNLSKLSEVMYVALESGHPSARLLLDVYHLYKGGSSLASLPLVGKPAMEIFHVNDYPANLTAEKITDADRIFTGDGVAPIQKILKAIHTPEQPLILSLEVFNKSYYAQDPLTVAKNGLAKMKAVTGGV